ncbi:EAL domain-containing protein [Acidihalobacter prosperus]
MLIDPAKADLDNFISNPDHEFRSVERNLSSMLHAVRSHLNLDVAFISEFVDGHRVFRYVDRVGPEELIKVGDSDPLEASFCQRVVDGRLPEVIPDAMLHPEASQLAKASGVNIGAHISVPIRLNNGDIYGTFCCFSTTPEETLNERDLGVINIFAQLAGDQIDQELEKQSEVNESRKRVDAVLANDSLHMVFQPIVNILDNSIAGFESLSRFKSVPERPPDVWFNEAASVGRAFDLEGAAILKGLSALGALPKDVYVSVNASPEVILSSDLDTLFKGFPPDRFVVEITEHAIVRDYSRLFSVTQRLKECGVRIAIDDAGAGYASFRHILRLAPDIIKIDASITRNIDTQLSRRALAAAIVGFANETDAMIIAEGVETEGEFATLKDMGVTRIQGYFVGKPMALEDAITFDSRSNSKIQL